MSDCQYRRADAHDLDALPPEPSEHETLSSTQLASSILARECNAVFWRFAKRHRIAPDEARILQLETGTAI